MDAMQCDSEIDRKKVYKLQPHPKIKESDLFQFVKYTRRMIGFVALLWFITGVPLIYFNPHMEK